MQVAPAARAESQDCVETIAKLGSPEIVGSRASGELPVLITDVTDLVRVEPTRFWPKSKFDVVSEADVRATRTGEEFDPHPERRHTTTEAETRRSKYFTKSPFQTAETEWPILG